MSKAHWQPRKAGDRIYLPKPPPPKLTIQRHIKHRRCDNEWKQGSQDDPWNRRDVQDWDMEWFPQKVKVEEQENADHQAESDQWEQEYEHQEPMDEWEEDPIDKVNAQEMGDEVEEEEIYQDPEAQMQEQEQEDWYQEDNQQEMDDEMDQQGNVQQEPEGMEDEHENWENPYPKEGGNEDGNRDDAQETEVPVPAPSLAYIQHKKGASRPLFVPLNKGKGGQGHEKSGMSMVGYPTPLTHPCSQRNPIPPKGGWPHPINDPQHPVFRGKGWIQRPTEWIPPQPPRMGYQLPGSHNRPMQFVEFGHLHYPEYHGPMHQVIPQGIPHMMTHDTGAEPSEDTDDSEQQMFLHRRPNRRRAIMRDRPRKHKVWLNVQGHKVLASYRK